MTRALTTGLLMILLLGACSSPPPAPSPDHPGLSEAAGGGPGSLARRMEDAIALKLLSRAKDLFLVEGRMPLTKLKQLNEQLGRDVNPALTSRSTRRQIQLLNHIIRAQVQGRNATSFEDRLARLTSVETDTLLLEGRILAEIDRLDRLTEGKSAPGEAAYPENSVKGRQTYLDRVSDALVRGRFRWRDSLASYRGSALSIRGIVDDNTQAMFNYDAPASELVINLADVSRLPGFELPGLAAYYGFPGIHALHAGAFDTPVQRFLDLPGYSRGWALYITTYLAGQDEEIASDIRRFVRLQVSLALSDLKLGKGEWSPSEALAFLAGNPAYPESRLAISIKEVIRSPGHYLAAFVGLQRFRQVTHLCLEKAGCTVERLHQQVINLGPVTFRMLEETIGQTVY